jgi:hypothetical protein
VAIVKFKPRCPAGFFIEYVIHYALKSWLLLLSAAWYKMQPTLLIDQNVRSVIRYQIFYLYITPAKHSFLY